MGLPHPAFVKTDGHIVPVEHLEYASAGSTYHSETVEIEVAHGEHCAFLVITGKSGPQYIVLDPIRTVVLGHALTVAVKP